MRSILRQTAPVVKQQGPVLISRMPQTTSAEGKQRSSIKPGAKVQIILKADQRSGKLTEGIVASLLTNSQNHPHGIKVKLRDGQVGRVQKVLQSA